MQNMMMIIVLEGLESKLQIIYIYIFYMTGRKWENRVATRWETISHF